MSQAPNPAVQILRRAEVERMTGLSRSTIYAKLAKGKFPKQIKVSDRAVGWLESEIRQYLDDCIALRNSTNEYKWEARNG